MKHGFTARLLAAAFGVALFATGASAQNNWVTPGGSQASGIVDMCLNSSGQAVPISSNSCANPMQVAGTFTATLGGFTPSTSGARGTPLTVTTSDTSGPLPTGAVDVVSNAGTTNPMYCNVNGVAATTSDQYIAPSGGWFAFTIPSGITTLHCIATGGSTTANMVGGSGLPTGTGGGSGGGSGGTVAQGTGGASAWLVTGTGGTFPVTGTFWPYTLGQQLAASSVPVVLTAAQLTTLTPIAWSNSNKIVPWDGTTNITVKAASTAAAQTDTALVERNPDVGTIGDTAWTSGNGTAIAVLKAIAGSTAGAIPAGTALIGKVGIDQTTPGTTNGVQVNAALPAGTNVVGFTSNDACSQATKLGAPINLTASGQLITGTASKKTYICSIDLISATAQNIALVEGTGSTCATNIYGLAGGTTAATGWNLPANGGLTKGSGAGTVYSPSGDTNATAANVCLLSSSTGQISGQITYVQQ